MSATRLVFLVATLAIGVSIGLAQGPKQTKPTNLAPKRSIAVRDLAQGNTITRRDSFVAKTPGVLSLKDSIRITTLEFEQDQTVAGYTFKLVARATDSDGPVDIAFGGSLSAPLSIKKGGTELRCLGQVVVKQADKHVPILLYGGEDGKRLGRLVGATMQKEKETEASGWIVLKDRENKEINLPLLKFRIGESLIRCVLDERSAIHDTAIPEPFLGKWIAVDNKNHFILVAQAGIKWERGDIEGPEVVPLSKCKIAAAKTSVSFPVRSSAAAVAGGRIVRGTVNVEMTASGDSLTISEGASSTISAGGFAFQQIGGAKHVFRKAPGE